MRARRPQPRGARLPKCVNVISKTHLCSTIRCQNRFSWICGEPLPPLANVLDTLWSVLDTSVNVLSIPEMHTGRKDVREGHRTVRPQPRGANLSPLIQDLSNLGLRVLGGFRV